MQLHRYLTLSALVALTPLAGAGVITGRVVDSLGNGVPGVNIAVDGSGGPTIMNGGTDAGGFFTSTITPDGTYDLIFEPPPPPATTHLVKVLTSINVTGTVNLGNVVVPPGVALSGRCVRAVGGAVVPNVNLNVIVAGVEQMTVADLTSALGTFSIAVPAGPLELRFNTTGTAPPLLAPHSIDLNLATSTNIGDVALQPGFVVSALVKRLSNNNPVLSADVDVTNTVTKQKLYTPGDNTDSAGFVDVVVPAGTYDIEFCPLFADRLVATTMAAQPVSSNLFLGTILLANGVVLSGNVKDTLAQNVANVDIDLRDSTTLASVTLCSDNTNALGNYAVVVPTGTFNVKFDPPPGLGLAPLTVPNVVIGADKTLNAVLGACVVASYCAQTKPTSVPGCTALLTACDASLSTGTWDTTNIPRSGTLGAAGTTFGIYIYTDTVVGQSTFSANNVFGTLCLPGFKRSFPACAPLLVSHPTWAPGTGACTTSVASLSVNCAAGALGIGIGDDVNVQFWYRDATSTNAGNANFSNAIFYTVTAP